MKTRMLLATLALLGLALPATAEEAVLKIYIPRTIQAEGDTLRLDAICVIRCADEELARKASAVAMGRTPFAGEDMTVTRNTIATRLVASGITQKVEFSGVESVSVTRNQRLVESARLVQAAEEFVKTSRLGSSTVNYRPQPNVKDIVLPSARGEIQLQPRLAKDSTAALVKVEVVVSLGGVDQAIREVIFKPAYAVRQVIAIKEILSGGVVSTENARIEVTWSERANTEDFVVPYGLTTVTAVKAGDAIRPSMLKVVQAPAAVRKNQSVVLKIEGPGFQISSVGVALQDGRIGDIIKVQNADSRRVVSAKVGTDGTLVPVVEEKQQ